MLTRRTRRFVITAASFLIKYPTFLSLIFCVYGNGVFVEHVRFCPRIMVCANFQLSPTVAMHTHNMHIFNNNIFHVGCRNEKYVLKTHLHQLAIFNCGNINCAQNKSVIWTTYGRIMLNLTHINYTSNSSKN